MQNHNSHQSTLGFPKPVSSGFCNNLGKNKKIVAKIDVPT